MACQITVDHNASFGTRISGVLQEIYLQGTLNTCGSVKVTLTCGAFVLQSASASIGQLGATAIWYHTFKNLPPACVCGGTIRVRAECNDGVQHCVNADCDEPFDLNCIDTFPPQNIPKCPNFTSDKVEVSKECDENGNWKVTVTQKLDSTDKYSAELRLGNKVLDSTNGQVSGPYTLTKTDYYPGNSNLNFAVVITYPNIGCGNNFIPVKLPSCTQVVVPGGGSWSGTDYKWGDCDEQGNRQITISWVMGAKPPIEAELRETSTGKILDKKIGNSYTLSLSYTGSVKGGTKFSYDVITYKPYYSKETKIIDIPACDAGGDNGGGDGGACGSMVWIVGALLSLGASLTALTLVWYLCIPASVPPVWVWASVIAIDIAAGLAIATWYIICAFVPDCKCPTKCDWLQIGAMTAFASATILAWLSKCCPVWPIAAGLGAAYTGALTAWIVACKPPKCTVLAANLTALVSGAIPAIAYIIWVPPIAACGSTLVSTIAATVGGILAAITAATCASGSKNP